MKTGIIGLPRSGKATIFGALNQKAADEISHVEAQLGTVRVPDSRVDILSRMYEPEKTIYAQVEYFLPATVGQDKEESIWAQVRPSDALLHVVRNFGGYGFEDPTPLEDFRKMDQELVFADLVITEKRLARMKAERQKTKKGNPEEIELLEECLSCLEAEIPLRKRPHLANAKLLRGYTFLSAKPMLVVFNNPDDVDEFPEVGSLLEDENCMVIRGKLEQELGQMSEEEAMDFLEEFNITASALDRVIAGSYDLLGLISFFTVGKDEVRAWTIPADAPAVEAAGTIHSDLEKGFIRAEVIAYEDLMAAGNMQEAKKKGLLRLEGKTYPVRDGDIMNIRFNV